VDIDGRPTCERISLEPGDPISGNLKDPDEGSGVHRYRYGYLGKKTV